MEKTIIIAEIGECFNGDLVAAEKLIKVAKKAGCDIVKFQTLDYENISEDDPEKEWFKKIALNPEKIARLVGFTKESGIDILFTPENVKTGRWILESGLKDVKIASSSINDQELFKFINVNFKRVFMSTGMAELDEIERAVSSLNQINDLHIMHCIAEYPTGPLLEKKGLRALSNKDVRLNMMRMLMDKFPQHKIGYSDHTGGMLAAIVAVAMGAKVIEKHITLDKATPVENFNNRREYLGTDHILSLEPDELKEMAWSIREVEKMFGQETWQRSEGEKILREFLRGRFKGE